MKKEPFFINFKELSLKEIKQIFLEDEIMDSNFTLNKHPIYYHIWTGREYFDGLIIDIKILDFLLKF